MLKLYRGGFGNQFTFAVAESEVEAINVASDILGIPYLPVTVEEVKVEGYDVQVVPIGKRGGEKIGKSQGDAGPGEQVTTGQGNGGPSRRKSGAGKKSD